MRIKLTIPESWNSLNRQQLESIVYLFSTAEKADLKTDVNVFKILVGAKWWQFAKKAKVKLVLSNIPISELKKEFGFVYKNNDRTDFIPVIKLGYRRYYSPQSRIINLTAEEFSVADDLHIRYRQTKDIEYLQYLFHVLYSEDQNRCFDKLRLPQQINKKIPLKTLLAVEHTYFGCKTHLAKKYKKVFPEGKGSNTGKRFGFGKVIQAMTKGDLSKLEVIEKVNIYKFLDQFQDDIEIFNKQKNKR